LASPKNSNKNSYHSTKDKSWSMADFLKTKTVHEKNNEEVIRENVILEYSNNNSNDFIQLKRSRPKKMSNKSLINKIKPSLHLNKKVFTIEKIRKCIVV